MIFNQYVPEQDQDKQSSQWKHSSPFHKCMAWPTNKLYNLPTSYEANTIESDQATSHHNSLLLAIPIFIISAHSAPMATNSLSTI